MSEKRTNNPEFSAYSEDSRRDAETLQEKETRPGTESETRMDTRDSMRGADVRPLPYALMVENSLTGMYIVQDGKIVFSNERFAEMFGYGREELIGKDSLNLVPARDRKTVEAFRKMRLNKENAPSEYEIRGLKKDGKIIWTVRRNVLVEYDGKPAILGSAVEITKRKDMESRLKKSEEILRFLSNQLLQAQENERKRIARELHDTVAQNLTGIKFYLSHKPDLMADDKRTLTEILQPAVELADRSIRDVRRLINDLRPPCIDDLGVLATIDWHFGQFAKRNPGISIVKDIGVLESQIPDALKVVIYRLLQESLNNVARHSKADKAELTIEKEGDTLTFRLEDNGSGFDIKRALSPDHPEKGWGIIGMKERAELSGGMFSIESPPGGGTRVAVSWDY